MKEITTVSEAQLYEFSKYVSEHPAYKRIMEEIDYECYSKFIIADDITRAELSNIMKGMLQFASKMDEHINEHITDTDLSEDDINE